MQPNNGKRVRRREVFAGFLIILVVISFATSLLLDFNFVSPYATIQEDLAYFSDNVQYQRISAWSWLVTALLTFITIPFYFMVFYKRQKFLHYLNVLFLLGATAGFVLMGLRGLDLHQTMARNIGTVLESSDNQVNFTLLEKFRDEQMYRRVGSTFIALFAIGLSLSKFRVGRIPLFSVLLLVVSAPLLIFYNWYDPEHLIRTASMAGIMIGASVFSLRLINKGLTVV